MSEIFEARQVATLTELLAASDPEFLAYMLDRCLYDLQATGNEIPTNATVTVSIQYRTEGS